MNISKYLNYNSISKNRSVLMGMAILNVMILHSCRWAQIEGVSGFNLLNFLCSMLFTDTFLFLSGFGLAYSLFKNNNTRDFYLRRIKRLVFPFMVVVLPFYVYFDLIQKGDILKFILDETAINNLFFHNNGMWYISASFLMYTLAPLLYHFIAKKSSHPFLMTGVLCLPFIIWATIVHVLFPAYSFDTSILWDKLWIFILGLFIGYQTIAKKASGGGKLLIICLISYIVFSNLKTTYDFLFCYQHQSKQLMSILLISSILAWFRESSVVIIIKSVFEFFGTYSLELYLLHLLFINIFWIICHAIYGDNLPLTVIRIVPLLNVLLCVTICKYVHDGSKWLTSKLMRI